MFFNRNKVFVIVKKWMPKALLKKAARVPVNGNGRFCLVIHSESTYE